MMLACGFWFYGNVTRGLVARRVYYESCSKNDMISEHHPSTVWTICRKPVFSGEAPNFFNQSFENCSRDHKKKKNSIFLERKKITDLLL